MVKSRDVEKLNIYVIVHCRRSRDVIKLYTYVIVHCWVFSFEPGGGGGVNCLIVYHSIYMGASVPG